MKYRRERGKTNDASDHVREGADSQQICCRVECDDRARRDRDGAVRGTAGAIGDAPGEAKARARKAGPASPARAATAGSGCAAATAGSAAGPGAGGRSAAIDLFAVGEALQQGRRSQGEAHLRHRQGRPCRIRPPGGQRRDHRDGRRTEEAVAHEPAVWRRACSTAPA